MGGAFIIPLVALLFPILLLLAALILDAAFISWVAYRLWHDRSHGRLWRAIHRAP